MLMIHASARLFLCQQPMTLRKSFEGLSSAVEHLFLAELFSGAYFIFLNRRRDHIKILTWDGDGFVIDFKRLEKGTFAWKWGSPDPVDRRALSHAFRRHHTKKLQQRFSL